MTRAPRKVVLGVDLARPDRYLTDGDVGMPKERPLVSVPKRAVRQKVRGRHRLGQRLKVALEAVEGQRAGRRRYDALARMAQARLEEELGQSA